MSLGKRSLVCGIGINDSWYKTEYVVNKTRVVCPYYSVWVHMLQRCYGSKVGNKDATYVDCTVCESWLTFSNFRNWMNTQDFTDKQLDKDLLVYGNRQYSPETCIFVTSRINKLLTDSRASKGDCPTGVHWFKRYGKYQVRCSNGIKSVHLGYFDNEEEAAGVYKTFKSKVILEVAYSTEDTLVREALIRIAAVFAS